MAKRTRWFGILGALVMAGGFGVSSAAAAPSISVGTASGNPGDTVTVTVSLANGGGSVAGTANDINFTASAPIAISPKGNCTITTTMQCTSAADCPTIPIVLPGTCSNEATKSCSVDGDCASGGTCTREKEPCVNGNAPDCDVNPAIGKGGFFSFRPSVCSNDATKVCTTSADCSPGTCTGMCSGTTCTGIRALILAVNNTTAIPDGALYSCKVSIPAGTANADYPLTVPADKVSMGDTSFHAIAGVTATPGKVTVGPGGGFTVCDVSTDTGDNVGQFGDGSIDIFDVRALFSAAQLSIDAPADGTARFSAMDSSTADAPPTCGGDASLDIFDVRACFGVAQFGNTNYVRTGTGANCTSAVQAQ